MSTPEKQSENTLSSIRCQKMQKQPPNFGTATLKLGHFSRNNQMIKTMKSAVIRLSYNTMYFKMTRSIKFIVQVKNYKQPEASG